MKQRHGIYSVHRYCKKQPQSVVFLRADKNTPDLQKSGLVVSSTIHTLLQEDQPKILRGLTRARTTHGFP